MDTEYIKIIKSVEEKIQKQISKFDTKVTLFLLGPGDNSKSSGKQLRRFLQQKCGRIGVVVKGEHKELIKIFHKQTGGSSDICILERWFAEKFADAVIIIPDSPGSLVELGMFVFNKRIYKKSLLLFSKDYPQDEESFINKGPRLHYKLNRVPMESIDYNKKKEAWEVVEKFLRAFRAEKIEKALLGR